VSLAGRGERMQKSKGAEVPREWLGEGQTDQSEKRTSEEYKSEGYVKRKEGQAWNGVEQ